MAEGGNQNMVSGGGDILTVQKNGVIAINNLAVFFKRIADAVDTISINTALSFPSTTSPTVAPSTTQLIVAGSGRIYGVSIPIHSGSAQISVYNSATTGGIANSNLIYRSLPSNAAGFFAYELVTIAYSAGIVIVTDAGMHCCVTYSPYP
jgi:hypothetical protein